MKIKECKSREKGEVMKSLPLQKLNFPFTYAVPPGRGGFA